VQTFVTCAACGARIRADRSTCLRCEVPLVAAPTGPLEFRLTPGQRWIASVVVSIGLLMVGVLVWDSMQPPVDHTARPYPVAGAPPRASAAGEPGAPADSPIVEPATSSDFARASQAAFTHEDFQRAKTGYEAALQKEPGNAEVLNALGQTLERLGDFPGAVAKLEAAVKLEPGNWTYHFNLAHAAGRLSQWDRAVAEYRTAAGLFPEDYATQFNLAMALRKQGNNEAAVPELRKAIALAPSEATFHLALGNTLQSLGKLAEARQAFETYLEMEPSAPDADKVKAHIEALSAGG
jgi:Flp pilus assembly protein TadD